MEQIVKELDESVMVNALRGDTSVDVSILCERDQLFSSLGLDYFCESIETFCHSSKDGGTMDNGLSEKRI